MSTGLYSNAEIYFNGSKLAEASSVKIARDSKASVVETIGRGFAGITPGAKMITISVTNAVPSGDFELNPGRYVGQNIVGELTVFAAGRTLTSKGFLISDSFSYATNAQSELGFEFVGEFADWV